MLTKAQTTLNKRFIKLLIAHDLYKHNQLDFKRACKLLHCSRRSLARYVDMVAPVPPLMVDYLQLNLNRIPLDLSDDLRIDHNGTLHFLKFDKRVNMSQLAQFFNTQSNVFNQKHKADIHQAVLTDLLDEKAIAAEREQLRTIAADLMVFVKQSKALTTAGAISKEEAKRIVDKIKTDFGENTAARVAAIVD